MIPLHPLIHSTVPLAAVVCDGTRCPSGTTTRSGLQHLRSDGQKGLTPLLPITTGSTTALRCSRSSRALELEPHFLQQLYVIRWCSERSANRISRRLYRSSHASKCSSRSQRTRLSSPGGRLGQRRREAIARATWLSADACDDKRLMIAYSRILFYSDASEYTREKTVVLFNSS